jgi:hypothetical protein
MVIPTKVTLEITAGGWTWTVFGSNTPMASHAMRRVGPGHSRGTEKGELYDRLPKGLEELAFAIEDEDITDICNFLDDVRIECWQD